jgi:molybdate transport system ATP-binding protein
MSDDRTLEVQIELSRSGHGESFHLDVSFTVPPGITILFGPSGSGKSTALQTIAGLQRPDRGRIALGKEVWFDSESGTDRAVHRRHIAYVFQSLALFPHLTAIGNVCYGIDRSVPHRQRIDRAQAMLARLGVDHLARRRPRTFSGGEAQRVALARALATSPRLLLLDEPFSALDRELRIQLSREVRELVDELNLPAIQVTHNHSQARTLGDRLIRMNKGRIVDSGPVAEVLDRQQASHDPTARADPDPDW